MVNGESLLQCCVQRLLSRLFFNIEVERSRAAWSDRDRAAVALQRRSRAALQRREIEWLRRIGRRYLSLRFTLNGAVLARPVPDRTRQDPTRPVPKPYRKNFFLTENGYAWGTHAAVPRRYTYPVRVRRPFCRTGAS